MEVHELTEEERDEMVEKYLKMLKVERKHLPKEDLEKEIIDYLSKKHPCSLATCRKDYEPRISVVDYMNVGTTNRGRSNPPELLTVFPAYRSSVSSCLLLL